MVQVCIVVLAVAALVAMAVRANRQFKDQDRLPMQWSLDGQVNWTAPRLTALAFIPALATIILPAVAALTFLKPRPGQEGLELPTIIFVALIFIGSYALHLRLIEKSVRRGG